MMEVWLLLVFALNGNEWHIVPPCCCAPRTLNTLWLFLVGSCFSLMTPVLHSYLCLCSFSCNSGMPSKCGRARFPILEFGHDLIWPTEKNRNVTVRIPSLGLKRPWETLCVSNSSHVLLSWKVMARQLSRPRRKKIHVEQRTHSTYRYMSQG